MIQDLDANERQLLANLLRTSGRDPRSLRAVLQSEPGARDRPAGPRLARKPAHAANAHAVDNTDGPSAR